jgi:hypothetical protein
VAASVSAADQWALYLWPEGLGVLAGLVGVMAVVTSVVAWGVRKIAQAAEL